MGGSRLRSIGTNGGPIFFDRLSLDKSVEYADSYKQYIDVYSWHIRICGFNSGKHYIEIDIDKTRCENSSHIFDSSEGATRAVPQDVVNYNLALARTSSLNPEISTMISDGISRMNRGEIREFEHRIEDRSGNTHRFIYRK